MTRRSCPARVPLGNVDPILSPGDALAVLTLAAAVPPRHETVVLLLDHRRVGSVVVSITGTDRPGSFVHVVEWAVRAARSSRRVRALVAMTVRPGGQLTDRDVDQWLEASAIAERHGIELVEWFVAGLDGVDCPRDLLGEPERW